jgi:hypothetical protein
MGHRPSTWIFQLTTDWMDELYNGRIVVPKAARREILRKLDSSHQGITRTNRHAPWVLYWPGMSNDIVLLVEGCQSCWQVRSSIPKEPMLLELPPNRIFEDVSADLFQYGNLHVLVYIDSLSSSTQVVSRSDGQRRHCSHRRELRRLRRNQPIPGPTRATQHPGRNGISLERNCLWQKPAFNCTGPSFFLCNPLESCHDCVGPHCRPRRQSEV